jgi:hypothetical protein
MIESKKRAERAAGTLIEVAEHLIYHGKFPVEVTESLNHAGKHLRDVKKLLTVVEELLIYHAGLFIGAKKLFV